MAATLSPHPGWIVCRKLQQVPVPSVDVLPAWAERGRVRPDDYLVNPILEVCFLAREVPALNAIFRRSRFPGLERLKRLIQHPALSMKALST
jgi:hypothetical protein